MCDDDYNEEINNINNNHYLMIKIMTKIRKIRRVYIIIMSMTTIKTITAKIKLQMTL